MKLGEDQENKEKGNMHLTIKKVARNSLKDFKSDLDTKNH